MQITRSQTWLHAPFACVFVLISLFLTACTVGDNSTPQNTSDGAGGKNCTRVGLLLPDNQAGSRWEEQDRPLLTQVIEEAIPNVTIDYQNAQGNSTTQVRQATDALNQGACILIVAAQDSVDAATIVEMAEARNVPVIAYDRLIQSQHLHYYIAFDHVKAGELQGQYIADHYREYQETDEAGIPIIPNIALINGSPTDPSALLFSLGVHNILDPLFASGNLNNVAEAFIANWDPSSARTRLEAAITQQESLQIAYIANDDMANGVIEGLREDNLQGKIMVTGQDATATGVNNILAGHQDMTIYKPLKALTQSVGNLVQALYEGSAPDALTGGRTTATFDGGIIPSILSEPILIDSNNISLLLDEQHLTRDEICRGIPTGTSVC
jgi:D-xylose transport system substrate-binding protein